LLIGGLGVFFDDLTPALTASSTERTITETDVMAFARLTGDFVRLHTDEEFAKTTPYGRRIAHGALVFSVSIGLATGMELFADELIAFVGVDKLRFVRPVFLGDAVHVIKTVAERKPLGPSQGAVTFGSRVLNQRGELVLTYRDRLLIKRRPSAENPVSS
jgi:acyl dehydratase